MILNQRQSNDVKLDVRENLCGKLADECISVTEETMENSFDHIMAQQNGDVLVLEIISSTLNDFDLAHATVNEIEKVIANGPNKKVILSLKNVDFMTSVGLIIFARLITHVKQAGTQLVLCDAAERIAKVLKLSRVVKTEVGPNDQRLLLRSDLDVALSELA